MSSSKIQLRLPEDMREAATRQAALSGVSMNLFVATAVAARLGGQAEAERYFPHGRPGPRLLVPKLFWSGSEQGGRSGTMIVWTCQKTESG